MAPIDVTSGNWVNLPIFRDANFQYATSKVVAQDVYVWSTLGMDLLSGITNSIFGSDTNTNDPTAELTYEHTWWNQYIYGKLNGIKIHLKNFLVSVERDTSGGIQWKDEPVFEIQYVPIADTFSTSPGGLPRMNTYTYTTTLKEGIELGTNITMGIINRGQLAGKVQNTDDPSKAYVFYPTLGEFLKGEILPIGNFTQDWDMSLFGSPQLHSIPYGISIRLINIPRGLSNIRVTLGYSAELKAFWTLYGRAQTELDLLMPPVGKEVPWTNARGTLNKFTSKRKNYEEEFDLV